MSPQALNRLWGGTGSIFTPSRYAIENLELLFGDISNVKNSFLLVFTLVKLSVTRLLVRKNVVDPRTTVKQATFGPVNDLEARVLAMGNRTIQTKYTILDTRGHK